MSRISFFIFLCTFMLFETLMADGIQFQQGSWNDMLARAKEKNQLVFVDAYTVWCGPCKMMDRDTFSDEEVGSFFNGNFVNYKFDMERGEGPAFARKYRVRGYPALYFIDGNGSVVLEVLGYKSAMQLLGLGKKALQKKKLSLVNKQDAQNSDNPEMLLAYIRQLESEGKNVDEGVKRYFETQGEKDLLSEKNWMAIQEFTHEISSREFQVLLDKKKRFVQNFGERAVNDKIYTVCKNHIQKSAMEGDEKAAQLGLEIARNYIDDKEKTSRKLQLDYAWAKDDWALYAKKAEEYFDSYIVTQVDELIEVLQNFNDHVDRIKSLESSLDWARQATALENSFRSNYVYALLLTKLNRHEEALRMINKAEKLTGPFSEEEKLAKALKEKIRAMM